MSLPTSPNVIAKAPGGKGLVHLTAAWAMAARFYTQNPPLVRKLPRSLEEALTPELRADVAKLWADRQANLQEIEEFSPKAAQARLSELRVDFQKNPAKAKAPPQPTEVNDEYLARRSGLDLQFKQENAQRYFATMHKVADATIAALTDAISTRVKAEQEDARDLGWTEAPPSFPTMALGILLSRVRATKEHLAENEQHMKTKGPIALRLNWDLPRLLSLIPADKK